MNNQKDKLLGLLGFAMRARKLEIGAERVKDAVRKHDRILANENGRKNTGLVLLAEDASFHTRKHVKDGCAYYNTECFESGLKMEELSKILGKSSDTSCVGIFDSGFASSIRKLMKTQDAAGEKNTSEERKTDKQS